MANPFLVLGGIAVGIVVATMGVLQVPCWVESAQDAAAKNDLANIRAAEAAHASKFGGFTSDLTALRDAENLGLTFESSGGADWTGLAANDTGWCASVLSASGKFISASSSGTEFAEGRDAETSVTDANCAPELIPDTIAGAPEPGAGGGQPGGGDPGAGGPGGELPAPDPQPHAATFVLNCPTTMNVNLPFWTATGTAEWSDGTTQTIVDDGWGTPEKTLTGGVEYTVHFDGTFEELSAWNVNDSDALVCFRRMDSWSQDSGTIRANGAFADMVNLTAVPSYLPTTVVEAEQMFENASSFNHPNITRWNTSNLTTLEYAFYQATSFNQPIGAWDTSSVTNLEGTFLEASIFNQSLAGWDTSNVTQMRSTFQLATAFNGDVSTWDVRKVIFMSEMFRDARAYNQPMKDWYPAELVGANYMFAGATAFQQDLTEWLAPKNTGITSFAPSLPAQFHPSWPALGL